MAFGTGAYMLSWLMAQALAGCRHDDTRFSLQLFSFLLVTVVSWSYISGSFPGRQDSKRQSTKSKFTLSMKNYLAIPLLLHS